MNTFKGISASARPVQDGDIDFIIKNLRDSDLLELEGMQADPYFTLPRSRQNASKSWTMVIKGMPAAIFGVGPVPNEPDFGIVWFRGTTLLDREGRQDLRKFSRLFIKEMSEGFKTIGNYVDVRNAQSIKWLMGLGFTCAELRLLKRTGVILALMVRKTDSV